MPALASAPLRHSIPGQAPHLCNRHIHMGDLMAAASAASGGRLSKRTSQAVRKKAGKNLKMREIGERGKSNFSGERRISVGNVEFQ